jgi:hypothetical protein
MDTTENRPTTWDGGRVRYNKAGEPVFEIRELFRGKKYQLTLDVSNEKDPWGAAKVQLAIFHQDRDAYIASYRAGRSPLPKEPGKLVLDAALIAAFRDYLKENRVAERGKPSSKKHVNGAVSYLGRWMDWLAGQSMRGVDPQKAKAWLATGTARGNRIKYIKALGTWMENEGLWRRNENWTYELETEKYATRKELGALAYELADVEELYRRLDDQMWRDVLRLLASYGAHYSEVVHLASGDPKVVKPLEKISGSPPIAGLVRVWHKNDKWHPIFLDEQAMAAVKRLQAGGGIPDAACCRRMFLRRCGYEVDRLGKVGPITPQTHKLDFQKAQAIRRKWAQRKEWIEEVANRVGHPADYIEMVVNRRGTWGGGRLTEDQERELRDECERKSFYQRCIAQKYGISVATVKRILAGHTYEVCEVERVLPQLTPGLFRHSVITWRRVIKKYSYKGQEGISLEDIVEVTGQSAQTARRHYDLSRYPTHMIEVPLRLEHPDDPPLTAKSAQLLVLSR